MLGGNVSLSAPECVLYLDLFSLSFLSHSTRPHQDGSKIDDSNSHDTRLAMASSRDEQADDFNSSDIEYEHPPPDPFGSAGAHSVAAILERASDIRVESKKASKQLQAVSGAPATRMQRARWSNAWQVFYTSALKKR
jgi:hypothetical protein